MNQKVIHNLPTTMVHATSIHYSKASSSQILASKYLSPCRHPNKKGNPPKSFTPQIPLQGKMKEEDPPQSIIIGINVEASIFLQPPPHPVSTHNPTPKDEENPPPSPINNH